MRPRLDSRAVLLAIGLGMLAPAPPAAAQQPEQPDSVEQSRLAEQSELPEELRTIESVQYRGMKKLKTRQLVKSAQLRTRKPSRLPWRERPTLRRDYLRADSAAIVGFYRHYGYLSTQVRPLVEPAKNPREAKVVFQIVEGPRTYIERVELHGVAGYPEKDLRKALLAKPKEPFDPAFLQLDTLRIKSRYRERGYFVSGIAWATGGSDSLKVVVHYEVREGPPYRVGEVDFETTGKVRESLGRREMMLKPGDTFSDTRLNRSVERLYGTSLYRQVQVTSVLDTTAREVDLRVRLSERKSRWVDTGVGSGSADRFRVSAEWGHRNLDTRALAGAVNGEYAVDGSGHFRKSGVGGTLTEPWLLGVRLLGQVGVFQLSQDDRGNPDFIRHHSEYGYTLTLFRELSRLSRATITADSRFIEQDYDTLPGGVVERPDTLRGSYRTNALRLTLERDLRDSRIVPGRGNYQVLAVEFAGGPLRGTSGYRKLILSSSWYSPLSNGWTFAGRALAGLMRPYGTPPNDFSPNEGVDEDVAKVPFEARFFIGGPNTLRGYYENSIPASGGLAMLLGNAEMRVPLAGPFGVEIFVDSGNVWDRAEYIQLEDFILPWQESRNHPDDIHWTYGIGARLELPFGPLRADLAWSDNPAFPHAVIGRNPVPFAYQFAIGAAF